MLKFWHCRLKSVQEKGDMGTVTRQAGHNTRLFSDDCDSQSCILFCVVNWTQGTRRLWAQRKNKDMEGKFCARASLTMCRFWKAMLQPLKMCYMSTLHVTHKLKSITCWFKLKMLHIYPKWEKSANRKEKLVLNQTFNNALCNLDHYHFSIFNISVPHRDAPTCFFCCCCIYANLDTFQIHISTTNQSSWLCFPTAALDLVPQTCRTVEEAVMA